MKFLSILVIAVIFNISAGAQEPHDAPVPPGAPEPPSPEEMTLIRKGSEKPIKLEDNNTKKKPSVKKENKKDKKEKTDH